MPGRLENFHRYLTSRFANDPALYVHDRLMDFDENPDHYYLAERPRVYKRTGDSKIYDGDEMSSYFRRLHHEREKKLIASKQHTKAGFANMAMYE